MVLLIRNGIKDPRVDSLISITDVEVTRDLSYATVSTRTRAALVNLPSVI